MDFILNTGDNYYDSTVASSLWEFSKVIVGPFLGVIGAFVISWIAFQREKKKTMLKDAANLESFKAHYFSMLHARKVPALDQVLTVRELAAALKNRDGGSIHFKRNLRFNFERVAHLDETTLFKALVLSKPNHSAEESALTTASMNVDFLNSVRQVHLDAFAQVRDGMAVYEKMWSENLHGLRETTIGWFGEASRISSAKRQDPYLAKLKDLFNLAFVPRDEPLNLSMDHVLEKFIKPLYRFMNEHSDDPRNVILYRFVAKCEEAATNARSLKDSVGEALIQNADTMETRINELYNAIEILEGRTSLTT